MRAWMIAMLGVAIPLVLWIVFLFFDVMAHKDAYTGFSSEFGVSNDWEEFLWEVFTDSLGAAGILLLAFAPVLLETRLCRGIVWKGLPMKSFAWFILLLRAVGIIFIALGLPQILQTVREWLINVRLTDLLSASGAELSVRILREIQSLSMFAIGLYLLFGGKWLIRRCLRGLGNQCVMCGYPTSQIKDGRCPECGTRIESDPATPPAP